MTIELSTERLSELIERQDWRAIAESLAGSFEPGDVWLRILATNLHSIRTHRPGLYATLVDAIPSFSLADVGLPAMVSRTDLRADQIFEATQLLRQGGRAIALGGIGDGRVLRAHARFSPPLQLGRQQEILVIEPDVHLLIAGLGCVDLSGPRGAFEQPRISWYVGSEWRAQLARDLITEPTRIQPIRIEPSTVARPELDKGLEGVLAEVDAETEARRERVQAYYDRLDDAELVNVTGPRPSRRPRVLMLTSQFSAVLQYSTNDSAHAMRSLGWDVRVCTEQQMWHSMGGPAIIAALDDFKPDLVFQIDHLRYELKDLIPAKLPFVCWIQDHLTNLTHDFAGQSVGERDFVLTGGAYRYVTRYGYPRRQCVDMPKCSRPPELPASWTSDREDLIYVSHWSSWPEAITSDICIRIRDIAGAMAESVMRECCSDMIRAYGRGESFRTDLEVRHLIRSVFARRSFECVERTEQFFVDVLFQRLNQVFYRQQSLTWAAEIADELGLKFGIYGKGWENHPTLGRFSRGIVKYGPDLEALTRESKILLQIEPYGCYTHQRMLDALLAGGFALTRSHPLNHLPIKVRQFLDAYVPSEIISVADAMESLAPPMQVEFEALLKEAEIIAAMGDVVDVVRGWQRAGIIGNGDEVLPYLDEIAFDSKETLKAQIRRFIGDESHRRKIAAAQRECVMERLTYQKALGRATKRIHELLSETIVSNGTGALLREAA